MKYITRLLLVTSVLIIFSAMFTFATSRTDAAQTAKEKLLVSGRPTMICFGTSYCPACKKALPALKAIQKKYKNCAAIHYIDAEENRSLTKEFPLQVVPTYFFYDKHSKPYLPSKKIREQIEFNEMKNRKTGAREWLFHMGALSESELEAILADLGVK